MDCAEAKLQIDPYVAGEIAEDQKGALEEHLAGCAECRLDSELTRASRSTPAVPDPNAAPAAFVESIRPGDAGDVPGANAGGAENATPGGASQAADGSWTLDSIFGAGGAGGAGGAAPAPAATGESPSTPSAPLAERAAAAAEPLPEHETALPALFDGPADATPGDEPPASDAPTWDFEPADQKGSAKPPEGSLFFAEEALSRSGTAARKKSAMPRILLWGAGGLVGVGLLALSIWIAMTVRQPLPTAGIAERRTIHAGEGPEAPGSPAATGAPVVPEAAPQGAPGVPGAETSSSTAPAETAPPAAIVPPPAEAVDAPQPTAASRASDMGSAPAAPQTSAESQASGRAPSGTSRVATGEPRAHAAAVAPPRKPPAEATSTKHATARSTPAPKPPAATKPVVAASPRPPDDGASGEATAPARPAPPATATSPAPGSDAATAGTPVTPASGSVPTPPAAASGQTVEPIDRLHLATLNAEQNADLVSLRKLRDAWRGFVRTTIGPDRARAKRELADCLWAIQTLTMKSSDQKEALVAYRDYILNAPAGGADARTVARMRQLEDAVAESR